MKMLPALLMTVREALDDKCSASGRAVHGPGFLSSTGSVVPVMTDLCSSRRPRVWKVWRLWGIVSLAAGEAFVIWQKETLVHVVRCNSHVWPAGGVIGLYLTRGVSEEVTDVRNDLTERQTLRSKPERNKTQQEALKKHELTTDSRVQTHELFTHTLSVEMRQRQSPSLVRLFLCLKPPIIRSHTNWKHRVQRLKWSDSDRSISSRWPGWRVCAAPVGLQPGPWSSAAAPGPGPGLGPWSLLTGRWGSAELRTHGQKWGRFLQSSLFIN